MKRNFNLRKKGVTLIEALMVASIGAISFTTVQTLISSSEEDEKVFLLSNQMTQIVEAFDKRLSIDRYDINKWPTTRDYNTRIQVSEFFSKELIAHEAMGCGRTDGWKPFIEDVEDDYRNKLKLVPCGTWSTSIPFGLEASLSIKNTGSQLSEIFTIVKFETEEDFERSFLSLKKALSRARGNKSAQEAGIHTYKFVNLTASYPNETTISTKECTDLGVDCGVYVGLETSGEGYEYLHVDGSNSMINSKVTFRKDMNTPKISTCISFTYDVSTGWTKKENIDCGIGIDNTYATPFVEANIYSATMDKLYLNKDCTLSTGKTQPCGLYKDPDNLDAVLLATEDLDVTDANIKVLTVDEGTIDDLTVLTKLSANEAIINTLTVNGETVLKGNTVMKGANNTIEKDLTVNQHTELTTLTANGISTFNENVTMEKDLNVLGTVTANNYKLGAITASELGTSCNTEERNSLKLFLGTRDKELAICANIGSGYKWKLANARINQVIAFNGTCPEGFEQFSEAQGRFLVGAGSPTGEVDQNGNAINYSVGDMGGSSFVKLEVDNLPSHTHDVPTVTTTCNSGSCQGLANVKSGSDTYWSVTRDVETGATGGDIPFDNRPSYYAVNYCIFKGN